MGFFKFLKKDKGKSASDNEVSPIPLPPVNPFDNQEKSTKKDNDHVLPPVPKPFDLNAQNSMTPSLPKKDPLKKEDKETKPIDIPLPPQVPKDPNSELGVPSFASKFGTNPDPEIQNNLSKEHNKFKTQKDPRFNLQHDGSTNPNESKFSDMLPDFDDSEMNLNDQPQKSEEIMPDPFLEQKKVPQKEIVKEEPKIPIHEHFSNKLDEHVEEKFSFSKMDDDSQSLDTKENNDQTIMQEHKSFFESKGNDELDLFDKFKSEHLAKEQEMQTQENYPKSDYVSNEDKGLDLDKPIFLKLEDCEKIVQDVDNIKSSVKDFEDCHTKLIKEYEDSDVLYKSFHQELELIQNNLLKVDNILFKKKVM